MIGYDQWKYLLLREGCDLNAMVTLSVTSKILLAFLAINFNIVHMECASTCYLVRIFFTSVLSRYFE